MNVVGNIPEFDSDSDASAPSNDEVEEEVLEEEEQEEDVKEDDVKEDSDSSTEDTDDSSTSADSEEESEEDKQKALQGLKKTEDKLDDDISDAKGRIVGKRLKRRTIRTFESDYSSPKPDDKGKEEEDDAYDVEFNDKVKKVIEKEGYVKSGQLSDVDYNSRIQLEVDTFTKDYPEYSSKNDLKDVRWKALQEELKIYAKPKDPADMANLLKRCHLNLTGGVKSVYDSKKVKESNLKSASKGNGKVQSKSYIPNYKPANYETKAAELRKGGWDDKEIEEMLTD